MKGKRKKRKMKRKKKERVSVCSMCRERKRSIGSATNQKKEGFRFGKRGPTVYFYNRVYGMG